MLNNEILIKITEFLSGGTLWFYFGLVILAFYLLIALFTWSFKRPLKFLGIPSIIAGLLLIISYLLINVVPISLNDTLIKIILSSAKPILNIGIVCFVIGIAMLMLYKMIGVTMKESKSKKH